MSPSELLELAERCERASGADRELDADIRLTVLGDCTYGAITGNRYQVIGWGKLSGYVETYRGVLTADDALDEDVVPRYTASLDAAMTLVPASERAWNVTVERDDDTWGAVVWHPFDSRPDMGGAFVSPALALTAASLRTRAAGLVTEDNRDG